MPRDRDGEVPQSATSFLPARLSLTSLRAATSRCRGCHLFVDATQTVFGEGLKRARIMAVGEQPGNAEDRGGRPFIGPAGRLLDRAIAAAGIDRRDVYVTNVVKHFKFERRGKARIHKRPDASEIRACFPWLDAEIEVVAPRVVIALGATAAKALLGAGVSTARGQVIADAAVAPLVVATWHPSKILRAPDGPSRRRGFDELTDDLRIAGWHAANHAA